VSERKGRKEGFSVASTFAKEGKLKKEPTSRLIKEGIKVEAGKGRTEKPGEIIQQRV
jgi:hypothetical protein